MVLSGVANGDARAGQLLSFDVGAPAGKTLRFLGYLVKPAGSGPHPAVVVLHSCAGFSNHTVTWADALAQMGYVALAIDSFQPRGITERCTIGFQDQTLDAWAARDYLAGQPYVKADSIGVVGFSMGGGSALALMERGLVEQLHPDKFKVAVAFYPARCAAYSGEMIGPTLILIGEKDDWTLARDCRDMVEGKNGLGVTRQPADRSMIEFVSYPDAWHAFDFPELRFMQGYSAFGHWIAYDDAATRAARKKVYEFLRHNLPP